MLAIVKVIEYLLIYQSVDILFRAANNTAGVNALGIIFI